ncbi:MAG TPA: choice-of-anchor tandem repeat GloVer-containing protein, partial [Burkholderiaceae bacterium]|nr:choice-of-anchor tandem repeat GloVer-containing protein [Burkholderiaceae bacterium]
VGTLFKFTPATTQSAAVESVLFSFDDSAQSGGQPQSDLIQATDGNLYGTTTAGGAVGYGTIFKF